MLLVLLLSETGSSITSNRVGRAMDQAKLVDETRVLHRELGPCVLVAKCYDLLDDYEEAKRVAAKVAKRESTDLAEMDRRRFS